MNFILRLVGNFYLKMKALGDMVESEKIKSNLEHCGKNVSIGKNVNIIPSHVSIGDDVSIGFGCSLLASIAHIHIGNHVMLAPGVVIRGGDHRIDVIGKYMKEIGEADKVHENDLDVFIGDDVWIGQNAIILKGVRIGEGSVIGAGSIVTKDVPPYTIHVGVHSTFEKERFTPQQLENHINLLKERKL